MSEEKDKGDIAAEAYQVIGVLAATFGVFDHPEVIRALDYFGDIAAGEHGARTDGEILPFIFNINI